LLILVVAESALELVPRKIWGHPAVKAHASRRGKTPGEILLDRSYHHRAMINLPNSNKRGRPDIVHFTLLEALGTPLNMEGLLRVYVHTQGGYVIDVDPQVRLPRSYPRFVGLMEQLFKVGRVPPRGQPLLQIREESLGALLERVKPTWVAAFTRIGEPQTVEEAVSRISKQEKPAVLVGGFPHGHFTEETTNLADELIAVDPETLDAWTVTSRIIYEYERALSIQKKRVAEMGKD